MLSCHRPYSQQVPSCIYSWEGAQADAEDGDTPLPITPPRLAVYSACMCNDENISCSTAPPPPALLVDLNFATSDPHLSKENVKLNCSTFWSHVFERNAIFCFPGCPPRTLLDGLEGLRFSVVGQEGPRGFGEDPTTCWIKRW